MSGKSDGHSLVDIKDLRNMAFEHVQSTWKENCNGWVMGELNSLAFNPGLQLGCPALQRFCKGFEMLQLKDLMSNVTFAWHGTSSVQNIASICHYGFNPVERRRQLRGNGEYFGMFSYDSHTFTGNTHHLILVQVLKGSHLSTVSGSFVVSNPMDNSYSFSLPLMVLTYGKYRTLPVPWIRMAREPIQPPFCISPSVDSFNETPCWHSVKHDGSLEPYSATAKQSLQHHLLYYQLERSKDSCTVNLTDWLQRVDNDVNSEWSWKTGGKFRSYPSDINSIIDCHHWNYVDNSGPPTCGLQISGINDGDTHLLIIDFAAMKQVNITSGYDRVIQRRSSPVTDGILKKSANMSWLESMGSAASDPDKEHGFLETTAIKSTKKLQVKSKIPKSTHHDYCMQTHEENYPSRTCLCL